MTRRRVVVTGLGAITPHGCDVGEIFTALTLGRSAVRRIHLSSPTGEIAVAGAPAQGEFEASLTRSQRSSSDRFGQLALFAANRAIADSRLDALSEDRGRIGVAVGTSMGGVISQGTAYEDILVNARTKLSPFTLVRIMYNAPAALICMQHGFSGPSLTYTTTCSSSSVAIGESLNQIRHGYADVMLAGGSEAPFSFVPIKAWEALQVLASEDPHDVAQTCKPFAADRTGTVLGEGAVFLVLEEFEHALRRGAPIHAELAGYGHRTDATHLTQPSVNCQAQTMAMAIADAGAVASDIDYVNAHGTGTQLNDVSETAALKRVLPNAYGTPVSSTKSMHGHLVGAAGSLELLICILALRFQTVPPTANLRSHDPECDLDYVANVARTHRIRAALSNSFAVGGTAASLVVRQLQ